MMTMQKSCQNSHQQRQQQYVRSDSPPPSAIKKSPLDMLVETCSSIGQELSKTSKPADVAVQQYENRKPRISMSPSNATVKPDSPPYLTHQQKSIGTGSSRQLNTSTQQSSKSLSATTNLGSHYQLMYQQLLYQAELEYLQSRNRESSTTPPLASKKLAEHQISSGVVKPACSVCSLTPGYVRGQCIHENPSSLNHMLAMLNPGSAAATVLAYSSKLASLNQTYLESSMPAVGYPIPLLKGWEGSRASPPSAHPVDSRRASVNSSTGALSPTHQTPPQINRHSAEKPIDLHVQKSRRSPDINAPVRLIECHWVGAEGYCGRRFHSQDDLMKHLKIHVVTCPNVVTSDDEPSRVNGSGSSRPRSRTSPSTAESASYKHSRANLSAILSKRFNPYSMADRGFPSMLLTPR